MTGLQPFDSVQYANRLVQQINNNNNNINVKHAFKQLRQSISSANKENIYSDNSSISSYNNQLNELLNDNKQLKLQVAQLQQQLNYAHNNHMGSMQSTQQFTLHHVSSPIKSAPSDDPIIEFIINVNTTDQLSSTSYNQSPMKPEHTRSQSVSVNTSMMIDDSTQYTIKIAELQADLERQQQSHAQQTKKQQIALFDASDLDNQQRMKLENQVKQLTEQLNQLNEKYNLLLQLHSIPNTSDTIHNDTDTQTEVNISVSEISLIDDTQSCISPITTTSASDMQQLAAQIAHTPMRTNTRVSLSSHNSLITPSHMTSTAVSIATLLTTPNNNTKLKSTSKATTHKPVDLESQLSSITLLSASTPAHIAKRLRSSMSAIKSKLVGAVGYASTDNHVIIPLTIDDSSIESFGVPVQALSRSSSVSSIISVAGTAARTLSVKQGISDIRPHKKILKDISNDWSIRSNALNKIEDICNSILVSSGDIEQWECELRELQKPMIEQIIDLRSSIVRDACRALLALANTSPVAFEQSLNVYLPVLYKGMYIIILYSILTCTLTFIV